MCLSPHPCFLFEFGICSWLGTFVNCYNYLCLKLVWLRRFCSDMWPLTFCFMSWTDDVLHTLTGAMSLLRRCRVNAALTIQLFSQLFHFINMWLFNRLVTDPDSGLCSHYWGAIIRQQLGHIEAWAEKQGLELAADCHLSRIVQVCTIFVPHPLCFSLFPASTFCDKF